MTNLTSYNYNTVPAVNDRLGSGYLNDLQACLVPVGGIIHWLKTFVSKTTRTNTSTSASKLIDSSGTFVASGVAVGMIVYNSTDGTFANVVSVDSATQLTLDADIFTSTGKTYVVYATPKLPSHFVECAGQTLSNANSPYNGATIPNLNASGGGTKRFLRGSTTSGTTGGSETHTHTIASAQTSMQNNGGSFPLPTTTTDATSTLPSYYEVVMIMRIY